MARTLPAGMRSRVHDTASITEAGVAFFPISTCRFLCPKTQAGCPAEHAVDRLEWYTNDGLRTLNICTYTTVLGSVRAALYALVCCGALTLLLLYVCCANYCFIPQVSLPPFPVPCTPSVLSYRISARCPNLRVDTRVLRKCVCYRLRVCRPHLLSHDQRRRARPAARRATGPRLPP